MTSMPTPYPDLNSVLHELVGHAPAALGENVVGAYLQGSFAAAITTATATIIQESDTYAKAHHIL